MIGSIATQPVLHISAPGNPGARQNRGWWPGGRLVWWPQIMATSLFLRQAAYHPQSCRPNPSPSCISQHRPCPSAHSIHDAQKIRRMRIRISDLCQRGVGVRNVQVRSGEWGRIGRKRGRFPRTRKGTWIRANTIKEAACKELS